MSHGPKHRLVLVAPQGAEQLAGLAPGGIAGFGQAILGIGIEKRRRGSVGLLLQKRALLAKDGPRMLRPLLLQASGGQEQRSKRLISRPWRQRLGSAKLHNRLPHVIFFETQLAKADL